MTTDTEATAQVIPIRQTVAADRHARSLRHQQYSAEPNIGRQPIAHIGWTIETRLGELWDRDLPPWSILALWAPEHRNLAEHLLTELFNVADEICEHGEGVRNGELYDDTLYALARLVQGAVVSL